MMGYPDNSHITTPVLNKLCFTLGIFFSFLTLTYLLSALVTGWSLSHYWAMLLLLLSTSQSIFTKSLPYTCKAFLLVGLFFLAGIIGFRLDTLYSFSISMFITSLVLANTFLGTKTSIFFMLLTSISIGIYGWLYTHYSLEPWNDISNIFMSPEHWLVSIIVLVLMLGIMLSIIDSIRLLVEKKMQEINKVNQELVNTYKEIQAIREIIPVCAKCKNIRGDKGFWIDVSKFLSDYPGIEIRESLCPECFTPEPAQGS